jgi:electron transport complex protein RnfG
MFKNTMILFLITLISGVLLGGVYELTKDARQNQEEKTKIEGYQKVFNKAESFLDVKFNKAEIDNVIIDGVTKAVNKDKEIIGYIVSVTSKEGYAGNISFMVGIKLDKTISGIVILSMNETAGLGMKAAEDEFLKQYIVKNAGKFIVNKEEKEEGNNIDAITGATITTKAMTNGVNAALKAAESIINVKEVK